MPRSLLPIPEPARFALLLLLALLAGCASWRAAAPGREPDEPGTRGPMLADTPLDPPRIREAFITPRSPADEFDSPTAWSAPGGGRWLIGTAKKSHQLVVFDGETGALLRRVGGRGPEPGRFDRPNGVFAWGDRLFVAERDNRRVQVLSLPGFTPLATFGEAELRSPYGLWLHEPEAGTLEVWVTDSYMEGERHEIVPALAKLDARLKRYTLLVDGDAVSARFAGAAGDTSPAGALRVVESVVGDPAHGRLLVAEEDVPTGTGYRVYDLEGRYAGRDMGVGVFSAQAEGLALWACPDGSGVWIGADQFHDRSVFHVFDRATLAPLGQFAGEATSLTDGLWLSQAPSARFPAGVLYASNGDAAFSAFDWRDIARSLGLPETCP